MLKHILTKLKSNIKIFIYSYIIFFITLIIIFLMLMFRSISIKKIESNIIFYDEAVRIVETTYTPYLPKGFKMTSYMVNELKSKFQYVNVMNSSFDLWAKGRQNVSFKIVSRDFINTGVKIYDYVNGEDGIQKIELLYGDKWDENTSDPVVIVDLDTALLVFGYENVVGEILKTNHGDLTIVGVVSNTVERKQLIDSAIDRGDNYADYLFETCAYIPHNFYDSLKLPIYNNDVIICDDNMSPSEIKSKLKNIFKIPQEENNIFLTKEDVVFKHIISNDSFFQIIISVISVFAILGCFNLVNINLYTFKINKRNLAIYKIIGFRNNQILRISIYDNLIKTIVFSSVSVLTSIIILLSVALINNTIKYIDINYLLVLSFSLFIVFIIVSVIINMVVSIVSIKKHINYYMEDF